MKYAFGYFVAFFLLLFSPAFAHDSYFGADLSFANEMDDCGAVFRENGQPKDVYALFKEHGANVARIRLWTAGNPTQYSNLEDVKRSLARAKRFDMQTLLDFHYSDWWADGGKQLIPAAWTKIKDPNKLAHILYRYTYDTLRALDKAGLMPDIVQPGNEINHELLQKEAWRYGPIDWKRNAKLLNAAIKAIRDAGAESSTRPKVMIQVAQPEYVPAWFEQAEAAGVKDFDMIGISYYAKWSNYSVEGLGGTINLMRNRYPNVKVMVIETAYPWSLGKEGDPGYALAKDNLVSGYPATPEGQKNYLIDLTQTVIANGGVGVFTWAPDWIASQCTPPHSGADWQYVTFFDTGNNNEVLPAIDYMRHDYHWPVSVTFRFHGLKPPRGKTFYLWGDFLGARPDFVAVPLRYENGQFVFSTTIMPGWSIRYQVFSEKQLRTPLLPTGKTEEGIVKYTVPADGGIIESALVGPSAHKRKR